MLALAPGRANAHPFLIQSSPAPDVVVPDTPRSVALSFTEPIDPAASRVRVSGPSGTAVATTRVVRTAPTTLTARFVSTPPTGVYHVRWAARGADGHTVSGSFAFGVPGAHGAPPPGVEALAASGTPGKQSASNEGPVEIGARWLGIVAAGVLLAGFAVRRRARRLAGAEAAGGGGAEAALPPLDERRWGRARAAAIVAGTLATAEAVQAAGAGAGGATWHEIVAEPRGQLALIRLGVLVALGLLVGALRAGAVKEAAAGAGGLAALVTYALEGHVQTLTHGAVVGYTAQIAHVTSAGLWMGGLVVLASGVVRGRAGLRAFAPVAAGAVALLALTGLVVAFREVDQWYFLRWSTYGRVVIAKVGLLVALLVLAGLTVRALRRGRAAGWPLRVEAGGALVVVLLASLLAGLPPGRGQLLPAQRGNLLTGASFATVSTGRAAAGLALAPAREGRNVLAVTPTTLDGARVATRVTSVRATLRCSCGGRQVDVALRRGPGGAWQAPVDLAARGTWLVTAEVDGHRSLAPAALAVGEQPVEGSSPARVIVTADLSGRDALRCRAMAQGALLSLGRFNARGGLPGGRKAALWVEDDGGEPARAAALVRDGRRHGAVALLAPCGAGADAALRAAGGLPAIVADPAPAPFEGRRVWRTGGDPYAEGLAIGQQIRQQRATGVRQPPRLVAAIGVPAAGYPEAAIARRLAGLTRALGTAGIRVRVLPESTIARPADLQRALLPDRYMATVLDGDPARVGSALGVLGTRATAGTLNPDQIVATSPLFDERFQLATGVLGRTGAISSPAEVMPDSADAQLYISQVRTFFRGDRPSIAGLRGYVAGLALGEGMRDGPDAGSIAARLRRPRPFTDALLAPWRASAPGAGAPLFEFQVPRFLSANLLPPGAGGDPHSGTWFDGGAWVPTSSRPLGLTGLIR